MIAIGTYYFKSYSFPLSLLYCFPISVTIVLFSSLFATVRNLLPLPGLLFILLAIIINVIQLYRRSAILTSAQIPIILIQKTIFWIYSASKGFKLFLRQPHFFLAWLYLRPSRLTDLVLTVLVAPDLTLS
jgi:hypothetical protein